MRRRSKTHSILLLCLLSVAVSSVVWAAGETIAIADAVWTSESNQLEAYFGESIGYAGDVNGDDFIVGARLYDNGPVNAGVAWLFYGSATGPNTTPMSSSILPLLSCTDFSVRQPPQQEMSTTTATTTY